MNARIGQLRRFFRLRAADQRTLLAAAGCLPLVGLGLRAMGLPRVLAVMQRGAPAERPSLTLQEMRSVASLVAIASRHTVGPVTCLTRSLLLVGLLRRRGVASQLRIGVSLAGGNLSAHAWVEADGVPINDQADVGTRFAPFPEAIPLQAFQGR